MTDASKQAPRSGVWAPLSQGISNSSDYRLFSALIQEN